MPPHNTSSTLRHQGEVPRNVKSLLGRRFGRLLVLSFAGVRDTNATWLCRCDCGTEKVISGCGLKGGRTHSCGCLSSRKTIGENSVTHGMCRNRDKPREHNIWSKLKRRCSDPADPAYPQYGGRGIGVCPRWVQSFAAFFADMGPSPSPVHEIDRIDNDRGYEPANCRWATPRQQRQNQRRTRSLTAFGETLCWAEWARRAGISLPTLTHRIAAGWSPEKAVSAPLRTQKGSLP